MIAVVGRGQVGYKAAYDFNDYYDNSLIPGLKIK